MQLLLSTAKPSSAEEERTETNNTTQSEKWMTAVKRGRKKMEKAAKSKPPPTKEQLLQKRRLQREAAIIASKNNGGKYINIIGKAKTFASQKFELHVAKTHSTRQGEMPLELKGLQQALMEEAGIKRPQWNTTLLVLHIEESVSAEDIAQAIGATGQVTTYKMRDRGLMAKIQVSIEKGIKVVQKRIELV